MSSNSENEFMNNGIDLSSFGDFLFSLSGIELEIINVIIAVSISIPLTINQQNSVGNFFEALGQNILLINAQDITRSDIINNPSNITIGQLNKKVDDLKDYLIGLINKQK